MKLSINRLFFALSLIASAHAAPGARQKPTRPSTQGGTVVFAVRKYESNVMMEPIVVYNRGGFSKPPIDDEAGAGAFGRGYFPAGRKYRLLSGGGC